MYQIKNIIKIHKQISILIFTSFLRLRGSEAIIPYWHRASISGNSSVVLPHKNQENLFNNKLLPSPPTLLFLPRCERCTPGELQMKLLSLFSEFVLFFRVCITYFRTQQESFVLVGITSYSTRCLSRGCTFSP